MTKREQHNERLMTKAFGSTGLMNSIKSIGSSETRTIWQGRESKRFRPRRHTQRRSRANPDVDLPKPRPHGDVTGENQSGEMGKRATPRAASQLTSSSVTYCTDGPE